ncbi:MAG TPA: DNA repair protein RecO [Dokdonella sp.]|uniref:DNA repair protein RecO n=1 Tax=Dokdonella sp. TaxID=2291710 RepID=UPI0025C549F1|nr:DNA repair protein RecO [Dokdonella sp.]MBX3693254.1 DNA repair protein RecO [Dokdonella sp.]MCW5567760.1 DNA repair protein RecO [Dokdonella sp.]HNR92687.1 DNA repair protein RecO [Dokdonella sp.]
MAARIESQPAWILHARAWRETSMLLDCLTRDHGRISLVARGVRRERTRLPRGLLQALQPLLLSWAGQGELVTLTGAEAAGAPFVLASGRLYAAMYLNELVLRLTGRGDPQPTLYEQYALCLRRLGGGEHEGWTLRRFERDLFAELGYALVLDTEHDHATPIEDDLDYAYRPDAGPERWHGQRDAVRVGGMALRALAADRQPGAESLGELRRLSRAMVGHLLGGRRLNAWALADAGR